MNKLYDDITDSIRNLTKMEFIVSSHCTSIKFNHNFEYFKQGKDDGKIFVTLRESDKWTMYAKFSLMPMPGCCGICISTNAEVDSSLRNKGLGKVLHRLRISLAQECGYSFLICTDITSNIPQTKILSKYNWEELLKFKNTRTGNEVAMHALSLKIAPTYYSNPIRFMEECNTKWKTT